MCHNNFFKSLFDFTDSRKKLEIEDLKNVVLKYSNFREWCQELKKVLLTAHLNLILSTGML